MNDKHSRITRRGVVALGVTALTGCSEDLEEEAGDSYGDSKEEPEQEENTSVTDGYDDRLTEDEVRAIRASDNSARGQWAVPAYCEGDCEDLVDLSVRSANLVFNAWSGQFALEFDSVEPRTIEIVVRADGSIKGSRSVDINGRAWSEKYVYGEGGDNMTGFDEATIYIEKHE